MWRLILSDFVVDILHYYQRNTKYILIRNKVI